MAFGVVLLVSPTTTSAANIVEIASGNPDFSSLVNAVVSRNLQGALSGTGPFTVFAPTNAAFASLPGFVSRGIAEKPELLTKILLYHVVSGNLAANDVLKSRRLETLEGSRVFPRQKDDGAYINSSRIVTTNIVADNGTVHVIDRVLIPREVIHETYRMELSRLLQEFKTLLNDTSRNRGNWGDSH